MVKTGPEKRILEELRRHGGVLRTRELLASGIHPRDLYELRNSGAIIALSRGVYALADEGAPDQPDILSVLLRIPRGVISHVSALAHFRLTEQIPKAVDVTIPSTMRRPTIDHPPVRVFQCLPEMLETGMVRVRMSGTHVRMHGPARAVVDCFKHRARVGSDVAIQALRRCLEENAAKPADILELAQVRRVRGVIEPVLRGMI